MNDDEPMEKTYHESGIAYLEARRRLNRSELPAVLNLPNGAYIAMAILATASLAAATWRPAVMPVWAAITPAALLMAGFAMKSIFGALMLHEGWLRWRRAREDDE